MLVAPPLGAPYFQAQPGFHYLGIYYKCPTRYASLSVIGTKSQYLDEALQYLTASRNLLQKPLETIWVPGIIEPGWFGRVSSLTL